MTKAENFWTLLHMERRKICIEFNTPHPHLPPPLLLSLSPLPPLTPLPVCLSFPAASAVSGRSGSCVALLHMEREKLRSSLMGSLCEKRARCPGMIRSKQTPWFRGRSARSSPHSSFTPYFVHTQLSHSPVDDLLMASRLFDKGLS